MASDETAIVKIDRGGHIQRRPEMAWTDEQRAMIRSQYAKGASEQEFAVLLEQARLKRLNPLLGQIHFVKRWSREGDIWATQTGIDGFRSIADETGNYDGQDEPEFDYEDILNAKTGEVMGKRIKSARVRVYRKDITRAFVAVAFMEEYVQKTRDGAVTKMWAEKPHIMLSKCAEALALRKAFPQELGDIYTKEEIHTDEAPSIGEQLSGAMAPRPTPIPTALPSGPSALDVALQRIATTMTLQQADDLAMELSPVFKGKKAERPVIAAAMKLKREQIAGAAPRGSEVPGEVQDAEDSPREPGWDG